MLKGAHDIFVVVVNFIHNDWEAKHLTILFEVTDTSGIAMATKLQELLDWFALIDKIVTYVNDERFNLQTCASALNSIISCSTLVLLESFCGSCLGHALSKACQYATIDDKVRNSLSYAWMH
jgi:hypothetical protein